MANADSLSAAAASLTESEYVDLVVRQSLETRIAESEVALARAEKAGAGLWPNPSLEWERQSGGGAVSARQDILLASVPLVLSGRLGLEETSAERATQAAEARAERVRAELHHDAIAAFSSVLAAEERSSTLEQSLDALAELSKAVEVRERAGSAAGYDKLRIEVEHASVEGQLRIARAREKMAASEALRLLGPSAKTLPHLRGSFPAERPLPELGDLLAQLETRRADVRALALEAQSAEALRRAAGRGWIPEPTVNAGVQWLDTGPAGLETGYVIGLALPLPLFERRQAEGARATAQRDLSETRRSLLLHTARTRVVAAFGNVTARREQIVRHRADVLARTEELRRIASTAYRGGSADLLILVDAERAAREAQLTAIELSVAVIEAETDLLLLSGAFDGAAARSTVP